MVSEEKKEIMRREGEFLRTLRERMQLSREEFADKIDIWPREVEDIENGVKLVPDKVIIVLQEATGASDDEMKSAFGDRWKK